MVDEFLTADRAKTLTRLLYVELAFAVIVLLMALPGLTGEEFKKYVITLTVIAVLLGAVGGAALRAIRQRSDSARKLCIATGIVLIVVSLPLVVVLVGLLTAVLGVGMLVVTFAPEREPR